MKLCGQKLLNGGGVVVTWPTLNHESTSQRIDVVKKEMFNIKSNSLYVYPADSTSIHPSIRPTVGTKLCGSPIIQYSLYNVWLSIKLFEHFHTIFGVVYVINLITTQCLTKYGIVEETAASDFIRNYIIISWLNV